MPADGTLAAITPCGNLGIFPASEAARKRLHSFAAKASVSGWFVTHLKGHTQGLEDLAIEMLARGLSVRDIEDAFKEENGRLLLSKTAASQLGERQWEDYQA